MRSAKVLPIPTTWKGGEIKDREPRVNLRQRFAAGETRKEQLGWRFMKRAPI